MKKASLLLLAFLLLVAPTSAFSQSNAPLASVLVELWPEYDRPSMLVIYHIVLSSGISLPYNIELHIPLSAGDPHAVAVRQADGVLVNIPYEKKTDNNWLQIIIQATSKEIQIEYYDPALQKQGNSRSYVYTWPGDFTVDDLSLDVQRPIGANNMQIIPGMATPTQRADGLTYYHTDVGLLSKGQTFEIKVQYSKSSDDLSINGLLVDASVPLGTSPSGAISITSILPWILGFFGLAFIIGGGIWYWRSGRQEAQPLQVRNASSHPPTVEAEDEKDWIYCSQCGKRAAEGDRYCRVCGTPLK